MTSTGGTGYLLRSLSFSHRHVFRLARLSRGVFDMAQRVIRLGYLCVCVCVCVYARARECVYEFFD